MSYVTKEDVLSRISQEAIMERYFPYSINKRKSYCNPFRIDKSPGCNFKYNGNNILQFVDWSYRKYYDCFEICKLATKANSFREVLEIIDREFNLNLLPKRFNSKMNLILNKENKINFNYQKNFSLKVQVFDDWIDETLSYWWGLGIDREDLLFFNVLPCNKVWINDNLAWNYYKNNPIFRYKSKKGIQVYRPLASKNKGKFTQDLPPNYVLGLEQLPETGDLIFITSSYKDVMVLYKLGIHAICPIGESGIIDNSILEDIKRRFKKVVVNFNPDQHGVTGAGRLLTDNDFTCWFIPKEKDNADFVKKYGYLELEQILKKYGAKYVQK